MWVYQSIAFLLLLTAWYQAATALRLAQRNLGSILTPISGALAGCLYFLLLPLAAIILSGEYQLPAHHNASENWSKFELNSLEALAVTSYPLVAIISIALYSRLSVHWAAIPEIRPPPDKKHGLDQASKILIIFSLFALSKWLMYIAILGWNGLFLAGWLERTESVGGYLGEIFWLTLKLWQANALLLTSGLIIVGALSIENRSWKGLPALAMASSALMIEVFLSGNRIFVALLIISAFTYLIARRRNLALAVFLLMFPALSILSGAWAYFRVNQDQGLGYAAEHIGQIALEDESLLPTSFIEMTEGANSLAMLAITRDFGGTAEYLQGRTLMKAFLLPVPRSIYPEKPENFNVIAAGIYEPTIAGFSLNATLLGEAYANLGILSVPFLIFVFYVVLNISKSFMRSNASPFIRIAVFQAMLWMIRTNLSDSILLVGGVLVAYKLMLLINTPAKNTRQQAT